MIKKISILLILFAFGVVYGQYTIESYYEYDKKIKKFMSINSDSALYYLKKANKVAFALKSDSLIAKTYGGIAHCQYIMGKYDDTKKNLNLAIIYSKKSKTPNIEINANNILGFIELIQGNHGASIEYYQKSITIAQKGNVIAYPLVYSYSSIAGLYEDEGDSVKMKQYYRKAIDYAIKNKFEATLPEVYNNYGLSFKNIDSAMYYLRKSLELANKYNQAYNKSLARLNIADLNIKYNKTDTFDGLYNELVEAEKWAKEIKSDYLLSGIDLTWGRYYEKVKKDFNLAKNYYSKSLEKSTKGNEVKGILEALDALKELYVKEENHKKALELYTRYDEIEDSVNTVQKSRKFQELSAKYEDAKKDNRIQDLVNKNKVEQTKKQELIFLGLAILLPLIVTLLFLRHKIKSQKIISEQENQLYKRDIENLRKEQEIKKITGVIEGQELERNRLAKELHDGILSKLATIKVNLNLLSSNTKELNKPVKELESTLLEIRTISHDLMNHNHLNGSFQQSLEDLFREIKTTYNLSIEANIYPKNILSSLENISKNHIHRIFQELLMNVVKHAKAKTIDISITGYEDKITFVFSDDGIGIDEENIKMGGIGLQNIRQRINSLDGTLTINSEKNKGSTFLFEIPNTSNYEK